jgi:H/ACA ribonucleoprotein complex subunit 3
MSLLKKMRKCVACGAYTLSAAHCGRQSASAHPARFNPNDPYAEYRRRARYGAAAKDVPR